MKILVIGGVAAGTKVAAKLKRENRGAEVRILAKDKDISYAGCGLPYYVGGVIADKGALIARKSSPRLQEPTFSPAKKPFRLTGRLRR